MFVKAGTAGGVRAVVVVVVPRTRVLPRVVNTASINLPAGVRSTEPLVVGGAVGGAVLLGGQVGIVGVDLGAVVVTRLNRSLTRS